MVLNALTITLVITFYFGEGLLLSTIDKMPVFLPEYIGNINTQISYYDDYSINQDSHGVYILNCHGELKSKNMKVESVKLFEKIIRLGRDAKNIETWDYLKIQTGLERKEDYIKEQNLVFKQCYDFIKLYGLPLSEDFLEGIKPSDYLFYLAYTAKQLYMFFSLLNRDTDEQIVQSMYADVDNEEYLSIIKEPGNYETVLLAGMKDYIFIPDYFCIVPQVDIKTGKLKFVFESSSLFETAFYQLCFLFNYQGFSAGEYYTTLLICENCHDIFVAQSRKFKYCSDCRDTANLRRVQRHREKKRNLKDQV